MKHDDRVDAYGEVDETNAWVGLARASRLDADLDADLVHIQRDLFALGAQLADPADKIADRVTKATLGDIDVARLEAIIDRLDTDLPPLPPFPRPGPADGAAFDERRAGRGLDRHIPSIARDAIRAVFNARRRRRRSRVRAARDAGGDRRAIDQHAHRDHRVLLDRSLAVVKARRIFGEQHEIVGGGNLRNEPA